MFLVGYPSPKSGLRHQCLLSHWAACVKRDRREVINATLELMSRYDKENHKLLLIIYTQAIKRKEGRRKRKRERGRKKGKKEGGREEDQPVGQMWSFIPIILTLKRLRQEDNEFEATLNYRVRTLTREHTTGL